MARRKRVVSEGGDAMEKARRGRKLPSAERKAAELALSEAKEGADESKINVARQRLKALRFREVVSPRVDRVLTVFRQIEKATNRAIYDWTDAEAQKIIGVLQDALTRVEGRFVKVQRKDEREKFKL